mmetsp:Transcript_15710/g.32480  ORF Transcript_15710/g.32480 Transcript_15710/m.32480 type:complete len:436 (-) Transcript_15710:247-1554(-)
MSWNSIRKRPKPPLRHPADTLPARRTGRGNNTDDVGSSRRSKGQARSHHQEIVGIRDQTLLEGSPTGISKHHVQVILRLLNNWFFVIKHVFLCNGVSVGSCLGEVRVDSPRECQLTRDLLEGRHGHDGNSRSILGSPSSRGSRQRKTNHSLGGDRLGDLFRSDNDGIGGGVVVFQNVCVQIAPVVGISLDTIDDSLLHRDRFFGVQSCCGFGAQHNGISTIINSSCNIGGFGSSGRWALNHRFQHLCGDDNRLSLLSAFINDRLLQDWNILRRAFYSKITSCHHDSVAQFDQFLQIVSVEARGFFDLGHNRWLGFPRRDLAVDNFPNFQNVFWLLDKRQSDPIDTNLQHVIQIAAILGCKWTDFENGIGSVDSLAVGNFSGNIDVAHQVIVSLFNDRELDLSVIDHERVTNFAGTYDFWVGQIDSGIVSEGRVEV